MGNIIKHQTGSLGATSASPPDRQPADLVFQVPFRPALDRTPPSTSSSVSPEEEPAVCGPTADEIRALAEADAEAIRAAALAEAGMLRAQAYEEGYQAGLAEGHAAAAQMVDASIERLRDLTVAATAHHAAVLRDAESQILQLTLAIARAILHREVILDPTLITSSLDALMMHVQGEIVTSFRVHPDDLPLLTQYWADHARSVADQQVRLVADHRITRGGCLVETTTSTWDATVETKFERITQRLLTAGGGDQ